MNNMDNMNNMNNMNDMNNMDNINRNRMINNRNPMGINIQPPTNPVQNQGGSNTFLQVDFKYFGDERFPGGVDFLVQGRGDMTIQQLIRNFRTKLADDKVTIKEYILDGRFTLEENSQLTVNQMGIVKGSVVTATKQ